MESPISEPPVSPPTQIPTKIEANAESQHTETPVDAMELDGPEINATQLHEKHLPDWSPVPQELPMRKSRSRSLTTPAQPEQRVTPKSRSSKSQTPPSLEQQEVYPTVMAEGGMEQQPNLQPATTVDENLDVNLTVEMMKTEDVPEEILMDVVHYDPPLPIARIESQGSVSEYVLDAKVEPDPPRTEFKFNTPPASPPAEEEQTVAPLQTRYKPPVYTLPPLKTLPPEFFRKGKQRQSRKRDKDKSDSKGSQEWTPLGLNKWSAVLRANPVHKRINKATKCLSTREWNVRVHLICT